MTNEEFIANNLCNDCNDKATCSVSCYWYDHMKHLAEWKEKQFETLLPEIMICAQQGYTQCASDEETINEMKKILKVYKECN